MREGNECHKDNVFGFLTSMSLFCFLSGPSNVKPLDGVKILDLTRFVFCLSFVTVSKCKYSDWKNQENSIFFHI